MALICVHMMRAAFIVCTLTICAFPTVARANIERYAVIIGNNRGDAKEAELRFAENDSQRVYDTLKSVGHFSPANIVLLKRETPSIVRKTLIAVNDRIRLAMSTPGTQTMLVVYYSGHADAASLHLDGAQFELSELEQLVRGSAATFRMLMLDACRSGALTRVKGARPGAPVEIGIPAPFDGEGMVFLTASSSNEDAQESDDLRSSYFTHFFVSALRGAGDANGDHRITLEEAYNYAYENTVRSTSQTWYGIQHPTYRFEFRGRNDIVLSDLLSSSEKYGDLYFPNGRAYLILNENESGNVLGEISAQAKSRRLRVAPGTYFIRGRASNYLLEGKIHLAANESSLVNDDRLTRAAYARVVRKGGTDLRYVQGPEAGYLFRTALRNSQGLCQGAFAGYAWSFREINVAPRVHGCIGHFQNGSLTAISRELGADIHIGHAWDLNLLTLELGGSGGVSLLNQTFDTLGIAPARNTFAMHVDGALAVSIELPSGLYIFSETAGQLYLFSLLNAATGVSTWTPSLALRQMLGLGIQL